MAIFENVSKEVERMTVQQNGKNWRAEQLDGDDDGQKYEALLPSGDRTETLLLPSRDDGIHLVVGCKSNQEIHRFQLTSKGLNTAKPFRPSIVSRCEAESYRAYLRYFLHV